MTAVSELEVLVTALRRADVVGWAWFVREPDGNVLRQGEYFIFEDVKRNFDEACREAWDAVTELTTYLRWRGRVAKCKIGGREATVTIFPGQALGFPYRIEFSDRINMGVLTPGPLSEAEAKRAAEGYIRAEYDDVEPL